jgi:hypothetical protein
MQRLILPLASIPSTGTSPLVNISDNNLSHNRWLMAVGRWPIFGLPAEVSVCLFLKTPYTKRRNKPKFSQFLLIGSSMLPQWFLGIRGRAEEAIALINGYALYQMAIF